MSWKRFASRLLDGRTLSRRILNRELTELLDGASAERVLDVGGASGIRYRGLVRAETYWTVDVQSINRPSIVGDAHDLPVASDGVDLVLCIQVLEHCIHPSRVIDELFRVLRPGGRLVLSTVLVYELHGSPHDYYRFSDSALLDMTRRFAQVRIITLGNRFVAAYDLTMAKSVVLNSLAGRAAYRLATAPSSGCPCGYIVDAIKPL
jgi:SAM-dependent methyltransferase